MADLQHCPSPRELDDLELLTGGALSPIEGYDELGSPVTLDLPAEADAELAAGRSIELVDPEGLPLARVTRAADLSLTVTALTHAQYGPFRRLHMPPDVVRERYAGRTFVPVTDALTDQQLAQIRAAGPVVVLALVGTGTAAMSGVGLLRATLRAVEGLDAAVVAVPLAAHDPGSDARIREIVIGNYADRDPVLTLTPAGALLPELADIVEQERPPRDKQGLVLFFTGLSGSGKSTLAQALMDRILEQGARSLTSLDGDVVRRNLSAGLTFSKQDRETNIRRIGWVAAEIARHGGLAVCSPIAPFDATRQDVRRYVADAGGAFFLVHVATPLEECERRDRKGLYAKARAGEIPEFTGISSPYEVPEDADVRVDTTGRTIEDALDDVILALRREGYLDLPTSESPDQAGEPGEPGEPGAQPEPTTPPPGAADGRPVKVLFVCTANICRSPYMQLRAEQLTDGGSAAEFSSAGTQGFDDKPADATMAKAMATRGITRDAIRAFRSRPVTRAMVEDADLVLTAESAHRTFLLEEVPSAFRKTFTLGQFTESLARVGADLTGHDLVAAVGHQRAGAEAAHDISDPYRRGLEAAVDCADQVDGLLQIALSRLSGRPL
ncbi:MAG: adenylyl-sulfate kinase [Micrococcales bacterium]|nr:adenylyl-sulfate kinase [Micrococcales bacterium]